MGLGNIQKMPIQGHIKRAGSHAIDKQFSTEADLGAQIMQENALELPGTNMSEQECTVKTYNV